jgi:outer membrane usher protein
MNLSSLRSSGNYSDLASSVTGLAGLATGIGPVRALDRVTITTPLPFGPKASLGASLLHIVDGDGQRSDLVSASWSRALAGGGSIFATAFTDFADDTRRGVFVGFSKQLANSVTASTSVSAAMPAAATSIAAARPLGAEVGSLGWYVQDSEGGNPYREARLAYRAPVARIEAGVSQSGGGVRGAIDVQGAMATIGGGVFFANRIDDAFAVVRVGVPNIQVLYDNRPVGLTDPQGMILIDSLRSYDRNQISIDPRGLPVDADIETTRTIIVPSDRAGVVVDLGARIATTSALVTFTGPDGKFIPVGSTGRSEAGEEFVVGYDGQSFLRKLAPRNAVVIEMPQGSCRAEFGFAPRPGEQVVIAPVECRTSPLIPASAPGGARLGTPPSVTSQ